MTDKELLKLPNVFECLYTNKQGEPYKQLFKKVKGTYHILLENRRYTIVF